MKIAERFWPKVEIKKQDDCWLWKAGHNKNGYGIFNYTGVRPGVIKLAHRVAWELTQGPIPEGLDVLHRCDNPPCVNSAHLFLGTQLDNVRDMYAKHRQNNVGKRKLTLEQIREIKKALLNGKRPFELAPIYIVSQQYISTLKTWTPRCWND